MKSLRWFALALALLGGSAHAETITDVSKINALVPGETTAAEAKAILGDPEHEDRNPDGRFVYMYKFQLPDRTSPDAPPANGLVGLLFGADGKFQRLSMYKDSGVPDPVKQAFGQAMAGEVLLNIAIECGWVADDAERIAARNTSLQIAVMALDVPSRLSVAGQLAGPQAVQFVADEAKGQVAKGACESDDTRAVWETLRTTPPPLGTSDQEATTDAPAQDQS